MPYYSEPVYKFIATKLDALANCRKSGNARWEERHTTDIESVMKTAPSGSGIDNGTRIDWDKSSADRLVFHASFHHMNENGYYDGWTEHTITVRASLAHGMELTISGRNRDDINEYLSDTYHYWLSHYVTWNQAHERYDVSPERAPEVASV